MTSEELRKIMKDNDISEEQMSSNLDCGRMEFGEWVRGTRKITKEFEKQIKECVSMINLERLW